MAPTAVEILSRDRLLLKGEMKKISENWEERTEAAGTIWPMGGTFDPIMYRDMEVVIRNYIDNRSGKTASAKRDREKLVLALFLEEGERWRTLQRVAGDIIANNHKAQPLSLTVESPLHKLVPLYPLLKDNVESKGEVTLDEGDNKCNNTDINSSESKDEDEDGASGVEHSNEDVKDGNEQVCEGPSPGKKRRGKRSVKRTKAQRSDRDGEESFCAFRGPEEPCCSAALWDSLALETQGRPRRSQREEKAPETSPGNYPILVEGQQVHFQPWGSQDLEGVISRLPNIINGASKWIRTYEELTVGKLIAVGDLKALLTRVLGLSKIEFVLRNGGLNILDGKYDETTLDHCRGALWATLRREFPVRMDPKSMRGLPIGDTENPASYLQAQVDRWRMETDEDPEIHPVFSVMFRNSVIETLPSQIKAKLEDVVGLFTSGSHKDFNDHLVHAVDEYRQNKQRIQEQSKEVQRKLYQLQLEDLTRKERDKKRQAGVLEPAAVISQAAQQGALQNQYPRLAFSLPVQQPQSQLSPTPPVTHVHIHNYGNLTNKNRIRGPKDSLETINNQDPKDNAEVL